MTIAAQTTFAPASLPSVDPVQARAQFFFDLELAELRVTIPQVEALADVPALF